MYKYVKQYCKSIQNSSMVKQMSEKYSLKFVRASLDKISSLNVLLPCTQLRIRIYRF